MNARQSWNLAPPEGMPELALQIDAGYIRAAPNPDGARWIGAVVSKLVARPARRGYTHAYAGTYNPHQGVRQQAFLTSVGVPHDAPITALADGGEDVLDACKLPRPTERLLDWFHIAMRFEHLLVALRGLRHVQPAAKVALQERAEGAKWLLWHGCSVRCLARLEALRRDTGWAGARNPLGRLIQYLRGFAEWLVDYARRYGQDRPTATSGAESAVNSVIGERMKKKGQMRWSRAGANALLQVRCAVLNGLDVRHFKRWYPPGQRLIDLPQLVAA